MEATGPGTSSNGSH